MAYPNNIDTFSEKLNKKQDGSVYVIEEELPGNYDGPLAHDNINDDTVQVYSGSRLTGEKVENFILSIPSETPWNRLIRIFSEHEKVYVIYETMGDQVEAEDINRLQGSMTATQTEVNRYKSSNDLKVSDLQTNVQTLENKKSDKTYVDTELNKKANKVDVYTKSQTDDRIKAVVGAAPEALDTLQEIGQALGNDPDFAGTMTNELSKKVDKISGKQLTTEDYTTADKNKLSGIETGANKYVHPSSHPATIITESTSKRFVSDAEKVSWNGKLDKTGGTITGDLNVNGKIALLNGNEMESKEVTFDSSTGVGLKLKNANGEVSITPLNGLGAHFYTDRDFFFFNKTISIINNILTSYSGDFQIQRSRTTKLILKSDGALFADPITAPSFKQNDGMSIETVAGAQQKVDTHSNDNTKHITASERNTWNAKSNLELGESSTTAYRGDRGKVAYDHSQSAHAPSNAQKNSDITKAEIEAKLTGNIVTHTHNQYVTQDQLGSAGYGDMTKAVYDTNNNGAVDKADSVPWTGVTGKPSNLETTTGAQAKVDAHANARNNPHNVTTQQVNYLGAYTRNLNDSHTSYPFGISVVFVGPSEQYGDWGFYGTVSTYKSHSAGGGTFQTYTPYGENGASLGNGEYRVRFWKYDGGEWTDWQVFETTTGSQSKIENYAMKKGPVTWNDLKGV